MSRNSLKNYARVTVDGRRVLAHRAIAERALGKPLRADAPVHHVDGDGKNNANSNLVICHGTAYHSLLHVRAKTVKAGGNPNTHRVCSGCCVPVPFEAFYTDGCSECVPCMALRYQRTRPAPTVNPHYRLHTDDAKKRVVALAATGMKQRDIGKLMGVKQYAIWRCLKLARMDGANV